MNSQFSDLSIEVTRKLTKKEKQDYGFFVTPRAILEKLFVCIQEHLGLNKQIDIIEPSCGTCEIVNCIDNMFNNANIDAVELNQTIYKSIEDLKFKNNVTLMNKDFMSLTKTKQYDLLVTNPPYFVCDKKYVPAEYKEYICGRPNIFGLFIIHSIHLVKPGGLLAFILPKSFMNSVYYSKIRQFVKETCTILQIIDFEEHKKFIDTEQSTIGLVLRKTCPSILSNCEYSIKIGNQYIFTTDGSLLKQIFEGATTIEALGLRVRTGQVVWNEQKSLLTNDDKHTLLIYNTNVTDQHTIKTNQFKNIEKGQYIKRDGRADPILIVNRGNGNSKYNLKYAIVDTNNPYLVENHLNEIYHATPIDKKELLEFFHKISNSFNNPRTKQFIDLYLGNNGLSKTELESIFPIYI
jgi:type I restriction-modification system DNA methylase subunit